MMLEDLAKKQSHSIPGYDLIDCYEAAFPIYRLIMNISILSEQDLPIIQEYILKIIDCEINEISEISGILGLSEKIIEDELIPLVQKELVLGYIDGKHLRFGLTDNGHKIMDTYKTKSPSILSLTVLYDALTGLLEPYKNIGLITSKRLKEQEIPIIKPYLSKPNLEDIELGDLRKLFKRIQQDNTENIPSTSELVDIIEVEKAWIEYKRLKILVFYSVKENDVLIQVFERSQRSSEYETILLRMEREGIHTLPTFDIESIPRSEIQNVLKIELNDLQISNNSIQTTEEKIKVLTQQLKEAEEEKYDELELEILKRQLKDAKKQLDDLQQGDRIISTFEHRPILEDALRKSKKRVIIISPWIERGGLDDDLLALISAALSRKVEILIGYGINDDRSSTDTYPIRKLKEFLSKPFGKYLKLRKLGNTHEKILVCDDKYVVITSFNWLSFKGDPKRGLRQETGVYSQNPILVQQMLENSLARLEIELNSGSPIQ